MIVKLPALSISKGHLAFLKSQLLVFIFAEIYYHHVRKSTSATIKYAYMFIVSNVLLITLQNQQNLITSWLHIYCPIMLTWIWTRLKWNPWPLVAILFTHLSYNHYIRLTTSYLEYVVDHSTILMLIVIKLTSFAFDQYDQKQMALGKSNLDKPERDRLTSFGVPTFSSYLGYCFLFPGFVSGPVISYTQFHSFINTHGHTPSRRHRSIEQMFKAVFFGFGYLMMRESFKLELAASPSIQAHSLLYRAFYNHFGNMAIRFMYYTAWLLSESSLILMGLGFNEETKRWDGAQVVRPLAIELATDPRQVMQNWNITTDRWLHRYFYLRFSRSLSPVGANMFTKMVSALWHGFYPGYYLTFISLGLVTAVSKEAYKKIAWPFFSWLRPFILYIPFWLIMDYCTPPHYLLEWKKSVDFYSMQYYWGHGLCLFLLAILKLIPLKKSKYL